jgi:serine/threonine-protein kinase
MAEIYRAEQELTGSIVRPAALKVIRQEFSESEDFREMFLDEARTACTLTHPNIVHIYEVGEFEGLLFMAMELVAGESLATVLKVLSEDGASLPDEALLAIGAYTCSALEAVHALQLPGKGQVNLVHRDVSPHNLLLSASGALKLIDFGIAKALSNHNLTAVGITKGKAGYFSPEQAMAKQLDGRSDLFSLGVTLYKLACGATPFDQHKTHQERHTALVAGRWKDLEEVKPGLLPGFYKVVRRSMRLRPEDRYATASDMREALEAVALDAGLPISTSTLAGFVQERGGEVSVSHEITRTHSGKYPRARPAAMTPSRRLGPATILLAASVLLAAAATIGWGLWRRPAPPPEAPPPLPIVVVTEAPVVTRPPPVQDAGQEKAPEPPPPVVTQPVKPTRPDRTSSDRRDKRPRDTREAPIPAGEGQLRVGSAPDGVVAVDGRKRGETPLNIRLQSGAYSVEIASPDTRKRGVCAVKVYPDKTTRLRYDFVSDRCAIDYL